MISNVKVLISGRVQGVWFRANTKQQAEILGLTGWVRNTDDGRVEAVFEGDEEKVNKMINWCHEGPALAKVISVDVKKQNPSSGFDDFSIRY